MAQDIEAVAQPADVVMATRDFDNHLAAVVESVPTLVAEVAIRITIMVAANMPTTAWVAIIAPADGIKKHDKNIVDCLPVTELLRMDSFDLKLWHPRKGLVLP